MNARWHFSGLALSMGLVYVLGACLGGVARTPAPQQLSASQMTEIASRYALPPCSAGYIGYAIRGRIRSSGPDDGAYLQCADGSSLSHPISYVDRADVLGMDLSPDHRVLATTGFPGRVDPSTSSLRLGYLYTIAEKELVDSRPNLNLWLPRWSPDGEYVGYIEDLGDTMLNAALKVAHVKSGKISTLVTKSNLHFWDWSPDGKRILIQYVANPGQAGQKGIARANVTCEMSYQCQISRVVGLPLKGDSPVWAHDSERIVTVRDGGAALDVTDASGTLIKSFKAVDLHPAMTIHEPVYWSPDGQKLAFIGETGSNPWTLTILNLEDGTATDLRTAPKGSNLALKGWYQ